MTTFHYVYFLQSLKDQTYYIGSTDDLQRRLREHHSKKASYTARKGPWSLVYFEAYTNRTLARKREYKLKHSSWHKLQVLDRLRE